MTGTPWSSIRTFIVRVPFPRPTINSYFYYSKQWTRGNRADTASINNMSNVLIGNAVRLPHYIQNRRLWANAEMRFKSLCGSKSFWQGRLRICLSMPRVLAKVHYQLIIRFVYLNKFNSWLFQDWFIIFFSCDENPKWWRWWGRRRWWWCRGGQDMDEMSLGEEAKGFLTRSSCRVFARG